MLKRNSSGNILAGKTKYALQMHHLDLQRHCLHSQDAQIDIIEAQRRKNRITPSLLERRDEVL